MQGLGIQTGALLYCGLTFQCLNMGKDRIIYWIATGLMCLVFAFSAANYLLQTEMIAGFYVALGFPTWLIYPSAIAKILGIIAVLSKKSPFLKEWAYAGFFFDAALALSAHLIAGDGAFAFALLALIATIVSRIYDGKLYLPKNGI